MKLETIPYSDYEKELPQSGKYILGQERGENIIVYQAFNPLISNYAIGNQQFGGSAYSFTRMSWIKPNFLWMMYRAGWASKEHQQDILAIEISKANFVKLLDEAVHSSYHESVYGSHENWKKELENSSVRLQWDPDYNPNGGKLERRAVQIGIKGNLLKDFATDWIISIEDITPFVKEQKTILDSKQLDKLLVIKEQVIEIENEEVRKKLELE
ncbi:MAG: hypothetical protein ACJAWV_003852 [Flammeovirgaceae bacterium]|jgi:hypothetical protein